MTLEAKCEGGQVSQDRTTVRRVAFPEECGVCASPEAENELEVFTSWGPDHGGEGHKDTTGRVGLTTPWQARAGSLGLPSRPHLSAPQWPPP